MIRIFYFLLLAAIQLQSASAQLQPKCFGALVANTDCSWYERCLEQKFQCGEKGYPISYGYQYCIRFGRLQSYPEVREWVEKTTICLKEMLVPYLNLQEKIDCTQLKKIAFKTHPICYNKGGFCELFKKLGLIKSFIFAKQLMKIFSVKDFASRAAIVQVFELGKICIEKWI